VMTASFPFARNGSFPGLANDGAQVAGGIALVLPCEDKTVGLCLERQARLRNCHPMDYSHRISCHQ